MADEGKRYREAEDPLKYLVDLRKRKQTIEREFNVARDAGDIKKATKCAERFYELGFAYHQVACEMINDFEKAMGNEYDPRKKASIKKLQERLVKLADLVNDKISKDPGLPEQ
ncbi:MAG: hypothetical protein WCK90_01585 [archaeon]